MIIIGFGGLGGAGKTTQINKIINNLNSKKINVEVLTLRNLLLWPKIVYFFRLLFFKKNKYDFNFFKKKQYLSDDKNKILKVYRIIRNFFYIIDFWRIYIYIKIVKFKKRIVLFDRYFFDFLVELFFPNTELKFLDKILIKLTPKLDVYFYFKIKPIEAFKRKQEFEDIRYLYIYEKIYINVLKTINNNIIIIDAQDKESRIFEKLVNLIDCFIAYPKLDIEALLLNFFLKNNKKNFYGLICLDLRKFLEIASLHKVLYITLRRILSSKNLFLLKEFIDNNLENEIKKAIFYAKNQKSKFKNTLNFIKTISKNFNLDFYILKSLDNFDLHSDIDVLFFTFDDYLRFIEILKNNNLFNYEKVNEKLISIYKRDLYLNKNFLPIDVHITLKFEGIKFFDKKDQELVSLMTLILQSFFETTLINLADRLKFFFYLKRKKELIKIIEESKKYDWIYFLKYWLNIINNNKNFINNYPYKIPILILLNFRFFYYKKLGIKNYKFIFKDFVNLLRALKVRELNNKIPFHDSWFNFCYDDHKPLCQ